MKVHLRADEVNDSHVRFTVFANGANCGQLCMRVQEGYHFYQIISMGCCSSVDTFLGSGHWVPEKDREEEKCQP